MGMQALQIGRVAQRTGLSVDTIRFYEKAGMLPRPARSSGGYRLYGEHEIADLEFIQKAQRLGFSLNEIRELFAIRRHPDEACAHVRDLIVQKLAIVRSKIEELRALEATRQSRHGKVAPIMSVGRRNGWITGKSCPAYCRQCAEVASRPGMFSKACHNRVSFLIFDPLAQQNEPLFAQPLLDQGHCFSASERGRVRRLDGDQPGLIDTGQFHLKYRFADYRLLRNCHTAHGERQEQVRAPVGLDMLERAAPVKLDLAEFDPLQPVNAAAIESVLSAFFQRVQRVLLRELESPFIAEQVFAERAHIQPDFAHR
jgi:DNA-binding transcriptional MerR regulator